MRLYSLIPGACVPWHGKGTLDIKIERLTWIISVIQCLQRKSRALPLAGAGVLHGSKSQREWVWGHLCPPLLGAGHRASMRRMRAGPSSRAGSWLTASTEIETSTVQETEFGQPPERAWSRFIPRTSRNQHKPWFRLCEILNWGPMESCCSRTSDLQTVRQ